MMNVSTECGQNLNDLEFDFINFISQEFRLFSLTRKMVFVFHNRQTLRNSFIIPPDERERNKIQDIVRSNFMYQKGKIYFFEIKFVRCVGIFVFYFATLLLFTHYCINTQFVRESDKVQEILKCFPNSKKAKKFSQVLNHERKYKSFLRY